MIQNIPASFSDIAKQNLIKADYDIIRASMGEVVASINHNILRYNTTMEYISMLHASKPTRTTEKIMKNDEPIPISYFNDAEKFNKTKMSDNLRHPNDDKLETHDPSITVMLSNVFEENFSVFNNDDEALTIFKHFFDISDNLTEDELKNEVTKHYNDILANAELRDNILTFVREHINDSLYATAKSEFYTTATEGDETDDEYSDRSNILDTTLINTETSMEQKQVVTCTGAIQRSNTNAMTSAELNTMFNTTTNQHAQYTDSKSIPTGAQGIQLNVADHSGDKIGNLTKQFASSSIATASRMTPLSKMAPKNIVSHPQMVDSQQLQPNQIIHQREPTYNPPIYTGVSNNLPSLPKIKRSETVASGSQAPIMSKQRFFNPNITHQLPNEVPNASRQTFLQNAVRSPFSSVQPSIDDLQLKQLKDEAEKLQIMINTTNISLDQLEVQSHDIEYRKDTIKLSLERLFQRADETLRKSLDIFNSLQALKYLPCNQDMAQFVIDIHDTAKALYTKASDTTVIINQNLTNRKGANNELDINDLKEQTNKQMPYFSGNDDDIIIYEFYEKMESMFQKRGTKDSIKSDFIKSHLREPAQSSCKEILAEQNDYDQIKIFLIKRYGGLSTIYQSLSRQHTNIGEIPSLQGNSVPWITILTKVKEHYKLILRAVAIEKHMKSQNITFVNTHSYCGMVEKFLPMEYRLLDEIEENNFNYIFGFFKEILFKAEKVQRTSC